MPKCLKCGNTEVFSSSKIPPEVPYANPALPLQGNFNPDGSVDTVEYVGNNEDVMKQAWAEPASLFNICAVCGSSNISW